MLSEKTDNISIEEEMENIDASKVPKIDKNDEVLAINHKDNEHNTKGKKEDDKHDPKDGKKEDRRDSEEVANDDAEIIISSASSSVNIDAEDSTNQGVKRISLRSTRQNFFSFESFSPRH